MCGKDSFPLLELRPWSVATYWSKADFYTFWAPPCSQLYVVLFHQKGATLCKFPKFLSLLSCHPRLCLPLQHLSRSLKPLKSPVLSPSSCYLLCPSKGHSLLKAWDCPHLPASHTSSIWPQQKHSPHTGCGCCGGIFCQIRTQTRECLFEFLCGYTANSITSWSLRALARSLCVGIYTIMYMLYSHISHIVSVCHFQSQ